MREKYTQSPMVNFFALLSSSSTLLCCALPAILVSMGAGAVFANMISVFPALTAVSRFKVEITVVTFIILVAVGILHLKTAKMPCPADPGLGRACLKPVNALESFTTYPVRSSVQRVSLPSLSRSFYKLSHPSHKNQINNLKRIEGQLRGVQRMIEEGIIVSISSLR